MSDKLSTEPYKGVRDFYPEDMAIQKHIFAVWRKVAESYGYEEYTASILEPSELYRSKTSDEIVNEQTYTFTDRGDREVTLRPEMTPTVARMVAGRKRELSLPLRWYSIPNCFRYERPQRGRLREFWQLNADIFGVDSAMAEVEMISMAYDIMKAFGAKNEDFKIRINSREIINIEIKTAQLTEEQGFKLFRILDKKEKDTMSVFKEKILNLLGAEKGEYFLELFQSGFFRKISEARNKEKRDSGVLDRLAEVVNQLDSRGIEVEFAPTLARGFDYYTGIIFEIFDTDSKNNRSLFGGGRYDRLLELFSNDKVPAVGFGMGDVTIRDFLETHDLLPKQTSTTDLMICIIDEKGLAKAPELAFHLRAGGVRVAVYEGTKKLGDQISIASKKGIPFIVCIGEKEVADGSYVLKELATGNEMTLDMAGITAFFRTR